MEVAINNIDKVRKFVDIVSRFDCDIDLVSGHTMVDAILSFNFISHTRLSSFCSFLAVRIKLSSSFLPNQSIPASCSISQIFSWRINSSMAGRILRFRYWLYAFFASSEVSSFSGKKPSNAQDSFTFSCPVLLNFSYKNSCSLSIDSFTLTFLCSLPACYYNPSFLFPQCKIFQYSPSAPPKFQLSFPQSGALE